VLQRALVLQADVVRLESIQRSKATKQRGRPFLFHAVCADAVHEALDRLDGEGAGALTNFQPSGSHIPSIGCTVRWPQDPTIPPSERVFMYGNVVSAETANDGSRGHILVVRTGSDTHRVLLSTVQVRENLFVGKYF